MYFLYMNSDWEYWCTIVPDAHERNIIDSMTEMANDGWELISANVHRAELEQGDREAVMADQCTMFWKRPADHGHQ